MRGITLHTLSVMSHCPSETDTVEFNGTGCDIIILPINTTITVYKIYEQEKQTLCSYSSWESFSKKKGFILCSWKHPQPNASI